MSNTYQEIYNEVYTVLGENPTSTVSTFDLNLAVKPMINRIQRMVCFGQIVNEDTGQTIRAGDLRFLYDEMFFSNVKPQKLTSSPIIGATTLDCPTSGYLPSGYLYINNNVVQYTGVTSTQFTGVTGVEISFPTSAVVYQCRPIPATASDPLEIRYLNQNQTIDIVDFRLTSTLRTYATIVSDSFSNQKYIIIYGYNSPQDQFKLMYYINPTDLVDDTDETILPDDWGVNVISLIVAGKLLKRDSFDLNKGMTVLREGYANLQNMYQRYAQITRKFKQRIQTTAYDNYYAGNINTQNIYYRAS